MNKKEQVFVNTVRTFFHTHGRHALPWRKTTSPYHILVSEVMLQQTQVERVIPKYQAFIKMWPTVEILAEARLGLVLQAWQGLGYNRRAKYLHECAKAIVQDYHGIFPTDEKILKELPGIGPYTAGAIMAFAYDTPIVMIETNIRTVYLHHFFSEEKTVSDNEILRLVKRTLPQSEIRQWYAALMDYGSYLKNTIGNQNIRSSSYRKQSHFKGSDREVRGAIIRLVVSDIGTISRNTLQHKLKNFNTKRVTEQLEKLVNEGLLIETRGKIRLP